MKLEIGETVFFEGIECEIIERKYDRGRYIVELRPVWDDDREAWNGGTLKRNEEIFSI